MRAPVWSVLAATATSFLVAGCQVEAEEESDDANADLIGGSSGVYMPATLHIEAGCTAAKIGPKALLTAAHCVLDLSNLEPKYDTTRTIGLSTKPASGYRAYAVARVHVHPAYLEKCRATLCSISAVVAKLDAPDIAVVELTEEVRNVPVVKIDARPLAAGDRVVIEGFGCTEGVLAEDTRKIERLTSAETTITAPNAALHEGSYVESADLPVYSGNYALTPGPAKSARAAGLCPGDSGGPLYARRIRTSRERVRRASDLVIVGVNANYTLRADDVQGLPVTNWHTRVDDASRNGVAEWLRTVVTF